MTKSKPLTYSLFGFHIIECFAAAIICSQAEQKLSVAEHVLLEIIFHWLIGTFVNYFGLDSGISIAVGIIRNIVWAVNCVMIQMLAGKNAMCWLWHLHSIWAIGSVYSTMKPSLFLFWGCFKISLSFSALYIFGHYSLSEALGICFTFVVWIMGTNSATKKLKQTQGEVESIHKKLINQYNQYKSLLMSISDVILKVDRNYILKYVRNAYILVINGGEYLDNNLIGKSLWEIIKEPKARKKVKEQIDLVFQTNKSVQWTWFCPVLSMWFFGNASPLVKDNQVVSATILISDITEKVISEKRKRASEEAEIKLKAKTEFISSISHELRNPLQAICFSIELLSATNLQKEQRDLVINIQESSTILSSIIGQILDCAKIESGKMEIKENPFNIVEVIETVADVMLAMAFKKGLKLITFVDPQLPYKLIGDATKIIQVLNNLVSNAIKFTPKGQIAISAHLESQNETSCTVRFKCVDTGIGISKENQVKLFKQFVQVHDKPKYPTFHEGWGLGLAISKGLVDMMNGSIGIAESQPGCGTTFYFTLKFKTVQPSKPIAATLKPSAFSDVVLSISNSVERSFIVRYLEPLGVRIRSENEISDTQSACLITDDPSMLKNSNRFAKVIFIHSKLMAVDGCITILKQPVRLHKLVDALSCKGKDIKRIRMRRKSIVSTNRISVLIVEDNPVIQALLKKILLKHGISEVSCASNGLEAVEMVEQNEPFSIILMDLQMPIMNGFEATRKIRNLKDPRKSKTPIIATSANANQNCYTECIACGMNGLLSKPITIDRLLSIIEQHCSS